MIPENPKPTVPSPQRVTALSWAGVGCRAIWEQGVAEAIEEDPDFVYDMLFGVSSGAFICAFMAAGQLPRLREIFMTIKDSDVYSSNYLKAFGHQACIYDNAGLRKLLKDNLDFKALAAFPKPVTIYAADLHTWGARKYELNKLTPDEVVEAIIASSAVPVFFPCNNGLVDGGVVNDYPIADAFSSKADRMILCTAATVEPSIPANALQMGEKVISIFIYNQLTLTLNLLSVLNPQFPFFVIQPETPLNIGLLDFSGLGSKEERKALMDSAKALAKVRLAAIKELDDAGKTNPVAGT